MVFLFCQVLKKLGWKTRSRSLEGGIMKANRPELRREASRIAIKTYEMAMNASSRSDYEETVVRKATLEWAIKEILTLIPDEKATAEEIKRWLISERVRLSKERKRQAKLKPEDTQTQIILTAKLKTLQRVVGKLGNPFREGG